MHSHDVWNDQKQPPVVSQTNLFPPVLNDMLFWEPRQKLNVNASVEEEEEKLQMEVVQMKVRQK